MCLCTKFIFLEQIRNLKVGLLTLIFVSFIFRSVWTCWSNCSLSFTILCLVLGRLVNLHSYRNLPSVN